MRSTFFLTLISWIAIYPLDSVIFQHLGPDHQRGPFGIEGHVITGNSKYGQLTLKLLNDHVGNSPFLTAIHFLRNQLRDFVGYLSLIFFSNYYKAPQARFVTS